MEARASSGLSRRDALKTLGAGVALIGLGQLPLGSFAADPLPAAKTDNASATPPLALPKLGYAYDALEPHIDAQTMEIHYTKHHQAYITTANNALANYPDLRAMRVEELLAGLSRVPEAIRTTIRNNVGGHANHSLFWTVIGPKGGGEPRGDFGSALTKTFGSFAKFKEQFNEAAMKRFGSGWAWLTAKAGALQIQSTANQDSPWMEGATPLLGVDVWEHAYYLKYQNRRADYLKAFWNVVSWEQVDANFRSAMTV
jgi:Fe-Mn family superoxide dismutase